MYFFVCFVMCSSSVSLDSQLKEIRIRIVVRNFSLPFTHVPDQTAILFTRQPSFVLDPDVPFFVLPVNVALSHLKIVPLKTKACKFTLSKTVHKNPHKGTHQSIHTCPSRVVILGTSGHSQFQASTLCQNWCFSSSALPVFPFLVLCGNSFPQSGQRNFFPAASLSFFLFFSLWFLSTCSTISFFDSVTKRHSCPVSLFGSLQPIQPWCSTRMCFSFAKKFQVMSSPSADSSRPPSGQSQVKDSTLCLRRCSRNCFPSSEENVQVCKINGKDMKYIVNKFSGPCK